MANRSFRQQIGTPDVGLVILPGTITIQSGGVPVSDTLTFAEATRTAAGTIKVTFEDSFVSLKSLHLQLENTGSQDLNVVLSGSSVGTGKSAHFHIRSGSSNVDPQNICAVHFLAVLKNSSV